MIFNKNIPKTYDEIIKDREEILETYDSRKIKQQVYSIYEVIIKSDPFLYLHHIKKDKDAVSAFLREHHSVKKDYLTEQIKD